MTQEPRSDSAVRDIIGAAPALSVVLPNFNHAHFLPRALDALLLQERLADEIIVIDDASCDDSIAVLERYATRVTSLRILRNETNQGALAALQRGLDSAIGRYVYFGAADDIVLPGFFATALEILDRFPDCGLFCGDAILLDGEDGRLIGHRPAVSPLKGVGQLRPHEVKALLMTADNFILTGSSIFRRDAVIAKGGFEERAGSFADGLLARKIALTFGLAYAPRAVAVWNVFSDSYSRKTALDSTKARQALDELPRLIMEDPVFPDWYPEIFGRRWRFAAARAAIESHPRADAVVMDLAGTTQIDKAVLAMLTALPPNAPSKWLILAWITMRLRPYRLTDLLATALRRRVGPSRQSVTVDR